MAEESIKKPTRRTERIGKYEILGHIATGGMGIIYKARDSALDRLVALKVLPPEMAAQDTTIIRFEREAKAAATLRHENIVTIYDVGAENGMHFIALEYIEGQDLQAYINRKGKLDPEEARQIVIQATRALVHAHEHGIVHRDIKPSNFLLTHKGSKLVVKLTDFGLAIRHENDAEFRITRDKTTVGTVDYMSPEQARDSRSADIRSDIYSLGCTFFHMLAGNAPFARGSLPERVVQHMQAPPPDVRRLNANVPLSFVLIINRMLMKKAKDRYQTPVELLDDLENPDQVAPPARPDPPMGKLEAAPPKSVPVEEEEPEAPRPVKRPKAKKPAPLPPPPSDDEVAASDDEVPAPPQVRQPIVIPPPDDDEEESEEAPAPETREVGVDDDDTVQDEDDEKPAEESPRKKASSPLWMYATAGSVGVLGLVLVFALVFGGRSPKKEDEKPPEKKPDPPPVVFIEPPTPEKDKDRDKDKDSKDKDKAPPPQIVIDTSAAKMGVGMLDLPIMDPAAAKPDRAALRKEYRGPFSDFPTAPADARVVRVGRLITPGTASFATLAEALAQTKSDGFTLIEIHDNGPLYVQALPALGQRSLVLRAAEGHRPLIVWETPGDVPGAKAPAVFATLGRGKLIVQNIDFVVNWTGGDPAVWFDLAECDFYARGCTFSATSKTGQSVSVVRRKGTPPVERTSQTWLQCCYVRGAAVTLLNLDGMRGDLFIDESLVVGENAPLIQMRSRENDPLAIYCLRSTLTTGQALLRWQGLTPKDARPHITARILDSILSRHDSPAPGGDMIQLADRGEPAALKLRAANTIYTGWRRLLSSSTKVIAGTDIEAWRKQLGGVNQVGRAQFDAWPRGLSGLDEQPGRAFLPGSSNVAYAAQTGSGSIGCVIGRLPAVPEAWRERVGAQRNVPLVPLTDAVPTIDVAADGLYHGEVLNIYKVDLGEYLRGQLQKRKPAPRIVMHLEGKGACSSSPIRIKGVQQLVLLFKPTADPKDAIMLELNSANPLLRPPMIEMTGGRLELIGLNVQLSPVTFVPTIVRVQDGDLTMTRCRLQGPLTASAENFKSLVTVSNAGAVATTLLLRDNVFTANKLLIDLHDNVQLKARNNAFVSLGDAVHMDANRPAVPMVHLLDHNTFAVKQNIFALRTGPDYQPGATSLVHANSNAFLCPFADSDQGVFLRGGQAWIHSGGWTWQGRYNVYDARLLAWFAPNDKPAARQTLADWQRVWGKIAEQNSLLSDAGPLAKTIGLEVLTQTALQGQLDRLALRPTLRGDPNQSPPGADLVALGILKKKG